MNKEHSFETMSWADQIPDPKPEMRKLKDPASEPDATPIPEDPDAIIAAVKKIRRSSEYQHISKKKKTD